MLLILSVESWNGKSQRAALFLISLLVAVVGIAMWFGRNSSSECNRADSAGASLSDVERQPNTELDARDRVLAAYSTVASDNDGRNTPHSVIRVVEANSHLPIASASVRVISLNTPDLRLVTDEYGSVECAHSALSDARLEIQAEGYCSAEFDVQNAPPDTIDCPVIPTGTIYVHVADEQGIPIDRAYMSVGFAFGVETRTRHSFARFWPNFRSEINPCVTDQAGDCIIKGMPTGLPLTVTASLSVPNSSTTTTIDVKSRKAQARIVVSRDRCIEGRVVWEDGAPVAESLEIVCLEAEARSAWRRRTHNDEEGVFRLCGVPQGRVEWRIVWPGEYSRCTLVATGPTNVGDIRLRHALECRGRISLSSLSGKATYGSIAIGFYQGGRIIDKLRSTNADGSFSTRIPEGPVTVSVVVAEDAIISRECISPFTDLVIELDAYVARLRVKNLPMQAGSNVTVDFLEDASSWSDETVADHTRHMFSTTGSPEQAKWIDQDLCLLFAPLGKFDVYVRHKESLSQLGHVETVAGAEVIVDAALVTPGRIIVAAKDAAGEPAVGIEVGCSLTQLRRSTTYEPSIATTDGNGIAEFPESPPGSWSIYPTCRGSYSGLARKVNVRGGEVARIQLEVGGRGSIAGTITSNGTVIRGGHVSIRPECERFTPRRRPGYDRPLDPDGSYVFANLLDGKYEVLLVEGDPASPGGHVISRIVDVVGGETTRFDYDLGASLTKLRITRDGAPFDEVDAGFCFTRSGLCKLERTGGPDAAWAAAFDGGPSLFFFSSKSVPRTEDPRTPQGCYMAYIPKTERNEKEIAVDIHGTTLVVRRDREDAMLPFAYLKSIGQFTDVPSFAFRPYIAAVDDADSRTFCGVPFGSVVVLKPDDSLPQSTQTMTLDVEHQSVIELRWPPK